MCASSFPLLPPAAQCCAEYILLGQSDFGNCGHNWFTWGNPDFHPQYTPQVFFFSLIVMYSLLCNYFSSYICRLLFRCLYFQMASHLSPPYALDGFIRQNIDSVSKWDAVWVLFNAVLLLLVLPILPQISSFCAAPNMSPLPFYYRYQLQRYDAMGDANNSRTVAFRRKVSDKVTNNE